MRALEVALIVVLCACGSPAAPGAPVSSKAQQAPAPVVQAQQAPAPAPAAAAPPSAHTYGASLPAVGSEGERELQAVLANPDAHADATLTVQGVVRQVCQTRGCWLELATGVAPDALGCRVVSQGHAFFVPMDAVGSRARVAGTLQVRTVPAAQVAHMESEGGKFAMKLPDGSAREVRITAAGVELTPSAKN